jgi:hypothetical protein
VNILHFMQEHNYKLYFLDELHFISKFHEYSSMASIPLGRLQIHITHKIGYKRNLKNLKSNPFYFMSLFHVLKKKKEIIWILKGYLSSFKHPLNEERKGEENWEVWGALGSLWKKRGVVWFFGTMFLANWKKYI